jgi:hypothetical protein
MRDTARAMLSGKDTALDTIRDLMTKPTASDNVRRQAAVDWMTFMHRSYELQTIEQRLSELEAWKRG